jgi:phage gpG-like protein
MPKAFEFFVSGDLEARARMEGFPQRLVPSLISHLNTVHTQLQRHIVSDKLSGQVLQSHTGNLKRNILQIPAAADGLSVTAGVGLGANAKYGLAHEFGADIYPKNAKALSWIGQDGVRVFAKHVKMPERSFLRTGFAEFQPKITEAVQAAVKESL